MPQQKSSIDWDAIPDSSAKPGIDWDKVPSQVTAPAGNEIRPRENSVANWFEDVKGDVKHGSSTTLPGRILHAMGAPGTEAGAGGGEGGIGDVLGGEALGPAEVGHALFNISPTDTTEQRVRGLNEFFRGVGHAMGPAAITQPELLPELVPNLAAYGTIGKGAGEAATMAGASPDTSELISTGAMLGTGALKPGMAKAGEFIEQHGPTAANVVGHVVGAYDAMKNKSLYPLVAGHVGARVAGPALEMAGKAMQSVDSNPLFFHQGQGPPIQETSFEPRGLIGSGATRLPPPEVEQGPIAQDPNYTVTRGKGGRMTKQYLTSSGGERIFNNGEKPLIDVPKAENTVNTEPVGELEQGPTAEISGKQKLETPGNTEPLSIIGPTQNTQWYQPNSGDLIDTKGLQQENRESLDRGQGSADELGKKIMYKGNKPGYNPDTETIMPWAETPWGENRTISSKVLPGDFSLNQPQKFYHGSTQDLSTSGIQADVSEGIEDLFQAHDNEGGLLPSGVNPRDYSGVYLGTEPQDAALYGRNVHGINLPRQSRLRIDPMHGAPSGRSNAVIYPNNITPDLINLEPYPETVSGKLSRPKIKTKPNKEK